MISKWITVSLLLGTQLITPVRSGADTTDARITRTKNERRPLCRIDDTTADEYGDYRPLEILSLKSTGLASSVELSADTPYRYSYVKSTCSAIIQAAPRHMLSLSLFPTAPTSDLVRRERSTTDYKESCPLRVFLAKDVGPRQEPLLSIDLCDSGEINSAMHYVESLPHTVIVEWTPPKSADSIAVPTSIVVTSIGKGERECSSSRGMVPCFKRSRKPLLCVATELVCDGRRNCPMEGDDEDSSLCSTHGSEMTNGQGLPIQQDDTGNSGAKILWDNLEFLLRAANTSTKQSTEKPVGHLRTDGEAPTLAKYGTWGYLLLAMLACGGLLTMCGLWECCCRQSKANPPSPPHHSPTTVLIINQDQQSVHTTPLSTQDSRRTSTPEPPSYEELDQPPAYGSLFPGFIKIEDIEEGSVQNVTDTTEDHTDRSRPSSPTTQRTVSPSSSFGVLAVSSA